MVDHALHAQLEMEIQASWVHVHPALPVGLRKWVVFARNVQLDRTHIRVVNAKIAWLAIHRFQEVCVKRARLAIRHSAEVHALRARKDMLPMQVDYVKHVPPVTAAVKQPPLVMRAVQVKPPSQVENASSFVRMVKYTRNQ